MDLCVPVCARLNQIYQLEKKNLKYAFLRHWTRPVRQQCPENPLQNTVLTAELPRNESGCPPCLCPLVCPSWFLTSALIYKIYLF